MAKLSLEALKALVQEAEAEIIPVKKKGDFSLSMKDAKNIKMQDVIPSNDFAQWREENGKPLSKSNLMETTFEEETKTHQVNFNK
jgi:hypothetical protein